MANIAVEITEKHIQVTRANIVLSRSISRVTRANIVLSRSISR